ncbi:MAG: ATP-dependent sacrificial sulfur transferase LarE [Planctomyces sp.]
MLRAVNWGGQASVWFGPLRTGWHPDDRIRWKSMTETVQDSSADLAERLLQVLRGVGPCVVAYSGGVDSAVVAKAAALQWGARALAVTAVSPSLAAADRELARQEAVRIGIAHEELFTEEFLRAEYRRNSGDRCFWCKDTLYRAIQQLVQSYPDRTVLNGANLDDLGDHRPGMQAAQQHGVRSPLIEAGLRKSDVRQLAVWWDLNSADKPASPCLSSRIAYGVEVTSERTLRIDQAEVFLRELLRCRELRVRLEQNELARIELPLEYLVAAAGNPQRTQISQRLRELGFRQVTLDLEGFRSGGLNDRLPQLVTLGSGSVSVEGAN